jgi:hypothetical protein
MLPNDRGIRTVSKKQYEIGGRNVFKDLAVPNAEEHQVKAHLVFKIDTLLKGRRPETGGGGRSVRHPPARCVQADFQRRTNLVHNGVMRMGNKTVRQSVSLPSNVAAQVRNLAKTRRVSANRMLLELIENGMEAEKRKQQEFFDLAERFRTATDSEEVRRLGHQMGRMVFGD